MCRRSLKSIVLVIGAQAVALISFAQDNLLAWPKKLEWSDFKGAPDQVSPHDAYTRYHLKYSSKTGANGKVTCSVNCSFQTDMSWKKTDRKLTAELLEHEQMHFNISEIYARKLRKAFSEYTNTHQYNSTTSDEMKSIFQKCLEELHAFQAQYDQETDHSKIEIKQAEWNLKIARMLKELSPYAQTL